MYSKTEYDLVIDGRNLLPPNRGISTFIINLIHKNMLLQNSKVLILINKSSEFIAKENKLNYKILHNYLIISDIQISFFRRLIYSNIMFVCLLFF